MQEVSKTNPEHKKDAGFSSEFITPVVKEYKYLLTTSRPLVATTTVFTTVTTVEVALSAIKSTQQANSSAFDYFTNLVAFFATIATKEATLTTIGLNLYKHFSSFVKG
jgi:hypothetical protein